MALTATLENYLKVIWALQKDNMHVRVTDMAKQLEVSKATVSQTVNKLVAKGLVVKEKYGKVSLTHTGQEQAVHVLERNRIIRRFLSDVLGVDEHVSKVDACKLEHILSDETMNKLITFID